MLLCIPNSVSFHSRRVNPFSLTPFLPSPAPFPSPVPAGIAQRCLALQVLLPEASVGVAHGQVRQAGGFRHFKVL